MKPRCSDYHAYYNRDNELRVCWVSYYNGLYRIRYGRAGSERHQTLKYIFNNYDDAVEFQRNWLNKHDLPSPKTEEVAVTCFKFWLIVVERRRKLTKNHKKDEK